MNATEPYDTGKYIKSFYQIMFQQNLMIAENMPEVSIG